MTRALAKISKGILPSAALLAWIALTLAFLWKLMDFATAHFAETSRPAVRYGMWSVYLAMAWWRLVNESPGQVADRLRKVETRSWPRRNLPAWNRLYFAGLAAVIVIPIGLELKADMAHRGLGLLVGIGCTVTAFGLSVLLLQTLTAGYEWIGRLARGKSAPAVDGVADS